MNATQMESARSFQRPMYKVWVPLAENPDIYDVSYTSEAIDPNTLRAGDVIHRYDQDGISSYSRVGEDGQTHPVSRCDASDVLVGACRFEEPGR